MIIHIGTDHAGFDLKEELKRYLEDIGHEIVDHGAFIHKPTDDYPDYIEPVAQAVSADSKSRGIILGGTGQGEAIDANRFKGVRAAVYYGGSLEVVKLSREHNDSNILSLGARFIGEDEAKEAINIWLQTEFSGDERHVRRIGKLDD
jgi:ribose 5-phosphate isomerase B